MRSVGFLKTRLKVTRLVVIAVTAVTQKIDFAFYSYGRNCVTSVLCLLILTCNAEVLVREETSSGDTTRQLTMPS